VVLNDLLYILLPQEILKSTKFVVQYRTKFLCRSSFSQKKGGRRSLLLFVVESMPRGWGKQFFDGKQSTNLQ
jgi:hypothetical protein